MKKEAAAGPAVAAAGPAVAGLWVAPSKGRRGGLRGKFIEPETLQWWVCTGVCSTRPAPSALDLSHCLAPLCHQARPSPTPPWAMSARAPPLSEENSGAGPPHSGGGAEAAEQQHEADGAPGSKCQSSLHHHARVR